MGSIPVVQVTVAHEFFDAISRGDQAAFLQMCTPDAVVWHNYDRADTPIRVVAQVLTKAAGVLNDYSYAHRRYTPLPDGVLAQHNLTGTLPGGRLLDVPMIVRLYLRESLIFRMEEYLDRQDLAVLASAVSE
jgi:ketosteroid isomerase-like protein